MSIRSNKVAMPDAITSMPCWKDVHRSLARAACQLLTKCMGPTHELKPVAFPADAQPVVHDTTTPAQNTDTSTLSPVTMCSFCRCMKAVNLTPCAQLDIRHTVPVRRQHKLCPDTMPYSLSNSPLFISRATFVRLDILMSADQLLTVCRKAKGMLLGPNIVQQSKAPQYTISRETETMLVRLQTSKYEPAATPATTRP